MLKLIYKKIIPLVFAQIRDSSEQVLAPALQVFSGQGTIEENFYLAIILIIGGLLVAIIWIHLFLGIQKLNAKILTKILTLWIIYSLGISAVTLGQTLFYFQQKTQTPAEETSRPLNITLSYQDKLVIIEWQTVKPTVGYAVFYTQSENPPQIALSNYGKPTTHHRVLTAFEANEIQVQVSIFSNGIEYRNQGKRLVIHPR